MKTIRGLNKKEQDFLRRELKRSKERFNSNIRFITGWILLSLIIGVIAFVKIDAKLKAYLYVVIAIYIVIGLTVFFKQSIRLNKAIKNLSFVQKGNEINSIVVRSSSYIQLAEVDDEGIFYLFQLDGDRILSFGGQDFYPTKTFPSNDFEIAIAYGPAGEIVILNKYERGTKLHPMLKISGEEKLKLISKPSYPDPEKFTIIAGRLENYKTILA